MSCLILAAVPSAIGMDRGAWGLPRQLQKGHSRLWEEKTLLDSEGQDAALLPGLPTPSSKNAPLHLDTPTMYLYPCLATLGLGLRDPLPCIGTRFVGLASN